MLDKYSMIYLPGFYSKKIEKIAKTSLINNYNENLVMKIQSTLNKLNKLLVSKKFLLHSGEIGNKLLTKSESQD